MNLLLNVILNVIGILIYFVNRYDKRAKKTTGFNFKFWINDNFQEVITTLLMNTGLMILLNMENPAIEKIILKLPEGFAEIGIPGLCFALGLGLSGVVYSMYKSKANKLKKT